MTTSYLYDYVLSPFYDKLSYHLWPDFVHPNFITLLGGLFAIMAYVAIEQNLLGWSCILFTLYHMCDNMDGKHARRTGQTSRFGGVLDHFVDGCCGSLIGFPAFTRFMFGRTTADPIYWNGIHSWFCLWVAPHIVGQFSGHLSLGTKFISIDEAFLGTSAILFWGWITNGTVVLFPELHAMEWTVWSCQWISLSYVFVLSAYHIWRCSKQQKTVWNHLSMVLFLHFWHHGKIDPPTDEFTLYMQWIPVLTLVLYGMES